MNVLVTGGAGYVGSHAAKRLRQAGFTPIVLDNLSTGHEWAVRWGPLVRGDIADQKLVGETLRLYRIEAVLHFAASAYVGYSMRDPRGYFRNNVEGSLRLLEAMVDARVEAIVFSSSCSIYGDTGGAPVTESRPPSPLSPYAESKLFVEKALSWYEKAYGLRWIALRYFNAAGADPDRETGEAHDPETHVIPLVIQTALGRRAEFQLYGTDYDTKDGTAIRDYIHVADLAKGHVLALQHLQNGRPSMALNLGAGAGHSILDIIRAVERITGNAVKSISCARREGDPASIVADPSQAGRILGWRPEWSSLDSIVGTATAWERMQNEMLTAGGPCS
jgi:UDP-arabinose 4-epimerase